MTMAGQYKCDLVRLLSKNEKPHTTPFGQAQEKHRNGLVADWSPDVTLL
jgi:hypothetical protein